MTTGEKIKAARKAAKLSQEQLGKKLNLQRTSISHYEQGITVPDIYTLTKIASALNVKTDDLIDDRTEHLRNIKDKNYNQLSEMAYYMIFLSGHPYILQLLTESGIDLLMSDNGLMVGEKGKNKHIHVNSDELCNLINSIRKEIDMWYSKLESKREDENFDFGIVLNSKTYSAAIASAAAHIETDTPNPDREPADGESDPAGGCCP